MHCRGYRWLKLYLHCSVILHVILLSYHTDYFIFDVVVVLVAAAVLAVAAAAAAAAVVIDVVVVVVVVRLAHLRNINDYLWHLILLFIFSSRDSFLTLNVVCKVHRLASYGPRIVTDPQILVRALCIQVLQL